MVAHRAEYISDMHKHRENDFHAWQTGGPLGRRKDKFAVIAGTSRMTDEHCLYIYIYIYTLFKGGGEGVCGSDHLNRGFLDKQGQWSALSKKVCHAVIRPQPAVREADVCLPRLACTLTW